MYMENTMCMQKERKMNWLDKIILETEEYERSNPQPTCSIEEVMRDIKEKIDAFNREV